MGDTVGQQRRGEKDVGHRAPGVEHVERGPPHAGADDGGPAEPDQRGSAVRRPTGFLDRHGRPRTEQEKPQTPR